MHGKFTYCRLQIVYESCSMTREMNNVFSCISWWACILSDQYFKSQQHYLKPAWLHCSGTPSSPDPSLLVKWVWLVRLHSPGPSPVEGYEHNIISELITMLIAVHVVVITWNNKILFTCPTLTFTYTLLIIGISGAMYSNWSVLVKSTDLNRFLYHSVLQIRPPFCNLSLSTNRGMRHFLSRLCPLFRCPAHNFL